MYTILINNDYTTTTTTRQRIMRFSKLVDVLQFIVPKKFNDWNVEEASCIMLYKSPISNHLKMETLQIVDNNYKNDYLLYTTPFDTNLTAENGTVEIQISFKMVSMDAEGKTIVKNQPIDPCYIDIIPISNWFAPPDEALDTFTQMHVANLQQIRALEDLIGTINLSKADNIKLDVIDGSIYLTANGSKIGQPISLDELGALIAEFSQQGTVKLRT